MVNKVKENVVIDAELPPHLEYIFARISAWCWCMVCWFQDLGL